MAAIVQAAAAKLNNDRAGVTGETTSPGEQPGARQPASPTEVLQLLPTEFGDLTGLFGGEATPVTWAPVDTSLVKPGGSRRGALGGLVPDLRGAVTHAGEVAVTQAEGSPLQGVVTGRIGGAVTALGEALKPAGEGPVVGGQPPAAIPLSTLAQQRWEQFRKWVGI